GELSSVLPSAFLNGPGYYYKVVDPNTVFVGLSNAWSTVDCDPQTNLLKALFSNLKDKNVIVFYHHPYKPIIGRYDSSGPCTSDWHSVLKDGAKDNKVVVVSGHTHGLGYKVEDSVTYIEAGAANNGQPSVVGKPNCNNVDYKNCEAQPGYVVCDSNLVTCYAKDKNGVPLFLISDSNLNV
ncbi:hypothetical protein CL616_00220, partial [archaeon]|nr:hypothetical protein [archaeon]